MADLFDDLGIKEDSESASSKKPNHFDRFDTKTAVPENAKSGGNFFDRFDPGTAKPEGPAGGDDGPWAKFKPQAAAQPSSGAGPWSKFDPSSAKPDLLDDLKIDAPKNPPRNAFAYANDFVIDTANAAAGLAKAGVDLVAPGSAPSKAIGGFIKSGEQKQSDWKQAKRAELGKNLADADGEMDKAGTYLKHAIVEDPLGTAAEVAGNLGAFRVLGGALGGVGAAARTGATMGVAGGLSAGEVRGNIFEKIERVPDAELQAASQDYATLRQTMTESDAKAQIAGSFSRNAPEVLAAGAFGALGGRFGFEGMAARAAPSRGRIANAAIGVLDEATQGATEQLASNVGIRRTLPDQSLAEDVALNAVAEGVIGLGGAAIGPTRSARHDVQAHGGAEQQTSSAEDGTPSPDGHAASGVVWRNKDFDLPVEVVGRPETDQSGRLFVQVRGTVDGVTSTSYVPVDELDGWTQPADEAAAAAQARLDQLAAEEAGLPDVPQSTPPDGRAALMARQEAERLAHEAETARNRAVASPDDEIHQSTGKQPLPSEQMGIDPAAGPMSKAAARAVDTGVSVDAVQSATVAAQARTDQLAAEEARFPDVPQSSPPDGRAIIQARQEAEQRALDEEMARNRAEASPDDEIYQAIGRQSLAPEPMGVDVGDIPALAEAQEATPARLAPFTQSGAESVAARWTTEKGEPYAVVPHPIAKDRFAVVPARQVQASSADAAGVIDLQGGPSKLGGALPADGQAPALGMAGEKINRAWTAFAEDSGSLGVPRAEMPQIKAEHRGAMTNFMNARGVAHAQGFVPADSLKPTQAEFSPAKVKRAAEHDGGDRSILVSADNYVLDGHHQWLAKRENGEQIKVIRLDAPVRELIGLAHEFPSSTAAKGAVPTAKDAGRTDSLARTASWVIRNKETGQVVAETFDRRKVEALNTQKYEAVPVQEHLASLNRPTQAPTAPEQSMPAPAQRSEPAQPAQEIQNADQKRMAAEQHGATQQATEPVAAATDAAPRGQRVKETAASFTYEGGQVKESQDSLRMGRGEPSPDAAAQPNVERAVRRIVEATNGVGEVSELNGPGNLDLRTAIISDLTGRPVADLQADPRHKFLTSIREVEAKLFDALGIAGDDLRARRAAYIEWLDGRGQGAPVAGAQQIAMAADEADLPAKTAPQADRRRQAADRRRAAYAQANPFRAFLGRHGISREVLADVMGDTGRRNNPMIPYAGPLFKKQGRDLDDLALLAHEAGFLSRAEIDNAADNGGTRKLSDMIRAEFGGETQQRIADTEDAAAGVEQDREIRAAAAMLEDVGVDTRGMSADDVFAAIEDGRYEEALAAIVNRLLDDAEFRDAVRDHANTEDVAYNDDVVDVEARIAVANEIDESAVEYVAIQSEDDVDFLNRIEEIIRNADRETVTAAVARHREAAQERPASTAGDGARQAGGARAVPGTDRADARRQPAGRQDDLLSAYSEADLKAQQDRVDAAARNADAARADAERKAAADSERNSFTLTGSARAADVMAAQGQTGLFDSPAATDAVATARQPEASPESAQQRAAIEQHNLPVDTQFRRGKGLARNAWIASHGKESSNPAPTIDKAAANLRLLLDTAQRRDTAADEHARTSVAVATKIRDGEQPTDAELRQIFGLLPNQTYVRQPAAGWFLVEHLGVPRNRIRQNLGEAGGVIRSDSGVPYPIVYPRRLHRVFAGPKAPEGASPAALVAQNRSAPGALIATPDAKASWEAMTPAQRFSMLDAFAGAGQTDMGQRYKDRAWESFNVGEKATLSGILKGKATQAAEKDAADQEQAGATNDRDTFTLERLNRDTNRMEPVEFRRGETVKIAAGHPMTTGEIAGISHANRKFRLKNVDHWYDFGYAYKAGYDEFASPRDEVDAILDNVQRRLDDNNAIEAEQLIQGAVDVAKSYNLGNYAWERINDLRKRAAVVSSEAQKRRAAEQRDRDDEAARRSEAEQAGRPEDEPIKMTMAEWKSTHKDFKGTTNGQRTVLRGGRLVPVEIVSETPASAPQTSEASATPTADRHERTMAAVRAGNATPEQFKESFESVVANADAIKAELSTKTKAELLREAGAFVQMRYANEKKDAVVDAAYREMLGEYALGETFSYGMARDSYQNALRRMVEATDADKLAQYARDRRAAIAEAQAKAVARAKAVENPQTLDEFRQAIAVKMQEGMEAREAFLTLTPEQRIKYDTLAAESTREAREQRKRANQSQVQAAGQTTGGQIIATQHTRDGYDLYVVQLADRLSREDYQKLLGSAKRMGGWYSSFRGNGATPGFQFKVRDNAAAFLKLAGGDTAAAAEQVQQLRDAFEDDRSQTAVERLREMADKIEDRAAQDLSRERKTNTARRARFAASAERAAEAEKALARTMRNIAQAIEDGKAKFLDGVRMKSQVEALTNYVRTAKDNELRAKHPTYAEQEKRNGEPPTNETADFAEFPSFTAYRSDLAGLARQMLEVDGAKKLGQQLMKVADDVTDAYIEFAKKPGNLLRLSTFSIRRGDKAETAIFPNREQAGRSIQRSGLTGKAIVLAERRGVNRIIMSPSEAMNQGIWTGDGDKRITLTKEFGSEMVEAISRRGTKNNGLSVPWQLQTAYDRRKALSRMGIETPAEFRSALREFIGLQERATVNKVREMELSMVGRKSDGLDFFPTPADVADQMVEAADITPDMAVLEPSAGMAHIADRIRAAGAEPDVIEISPDRRELLLEKGYHLAEVDDFMDMEPRKFFTYGDVFRAPDGTEGIMRGSGGMGSQRVRLEDESGNRLGLYDRDELTGVAHRGTLSGYDRIIMNPPFSKRRDAEHVRHAYSLLKPGGRIVAIMGDGVFFGQDAKAQDFRDWLESVGGTSEKLPSGAFMDASLPVNTGVNARMVVIDRPAGDLQLPDATDVREAALFRLGEGVDLGPMDFGAAAAVVGRIVAANKKNWDVGIDTVPTFDALPDDVKKAVAKYGEDEKPKGVLHQGRVYVVADRHTSEADVEATILHEVEGHVGTHRLYGKDINTRLNQLYLAIGGRKGLSEIARKRGITSLGAYAEALGKSEFTDDVRVQIMMDEVLAHVAESRKFGDRVKAIVGAIRQWLRDHGFAELAEYGETDLLHILAQGRKQLKTVKADAGQTVLLFAGRDAETADRHALTSAQRRIAQGEDAEAVRQDTGWHRGADGMWRFEISDDQAQIKVGGNTAAEILDAAALDADTVRVGEVLDHPQLFAAYPHLENVRVELMPAGEPAIARLMRDAIGARMQVRGSVKRAALPSVMLHELQHAIQSAEDFAPGGSQSALASDLDKTGADTYRRLAGEVEARNTQSRQRMTPAQRRAVSPDDTADVPAGDVIVAVNGQPVTAAPSNAVATAPMTERGLVRALRRQFPGLVAPVESMLERGGRGQRGGLVMIDSADPLRIAGVFSKKTGRALDDSIELFSGGGKPKGFYDARSGLTFVFGPNVDAVTAPAVLLHEMVHGQQKQRIDRLARDMLMNRRAEPDADLRAFLDRVVERIADADAVGDMREFAAYIVEQAVTEGRSRGYTMVDGRFFAWADSTLGKKMGDFLRSVAAMVRSWMIRHGGIKALTVDDLVGYAMVGVERAARGSVAGGKHVSASLSDPEVRALVEQYAGVDGAPSEAQLRDAVRQFRETERAYGGREGYDRAKSAGKTKLNYRQWIQVRTPNFKAWFGDWESAALRAFLDGPPLQKLKTSDAPHQGFAKLRDWAVGIFADYGNYATNETLGRVLMDERAVRDSMGHRMSPFKAIAFKAVPDVIERGKVVHSERSGNVDSFWISAPVEIDGTADIVTVMVHRDPATQRMYLHSVATKEYLLNHKQSGAPNKSASSPGAVRAGGIEKILHGALNFNGEVSKVTDPETGEPLMMFHGSRNGDITKFAPSTYFTEDASEAGDYATGHAVYPAYINIRRPYEASDDVDEENRSELTEIDEDYAEQLSTEGHDGVVARRNGETLWAIPFSQEHVKSAAGNVGTFDGASADIRFSRSGLATQGQTQVRTSDAFGDLSTDQRTFLDKVGTPPTRVRVSEWVKARADRIGTKIRQGLVDRYASLKELDEKLHGKDFIDTAITDSSWVMARMASSAAGAMSAMMNTGRIRFDAKQRVIAMQDGDQSGGLVAVLSQIGDPAEVERFMAWIAANRADKLMKEGREHLFTPDEIDAGKTLNVGRTTDGRGRAMVYAKAFREFQQYRDDVLAVAEATGAISAENRAMWKDEFYVPFYRVMDEEATKGAPRGSKGLSRQEAYKRLKGGSQNLNDLLENTLMNFHHLLTSGLKNQAAAQTIHNAKALGIARKVSDSERDPKTSTFVLEDGKRVFYEIDDPLVYEALTTLSDPGLNSTAVRVMSSFKRLFTNMTTVTPQFIVANLMRDLMQATATSPVSKNVFKNLGQGLKGYADEKTRAQMMASGGAFSFGHLYGADVDEVKASLARQMKGSQLISDPSMIPKAIKAGWNAWGKVTDSAENVSRAAVFQQNMDKGALRAAFEARDLMDFSSHGAWPAVRFLIRVVPFLNARLQGLDKIYRAGVKPSLLVAMGKGSASDRQAAARFAVVTGALTLATIALYLANADDDDYRELEDWQKDTYWVFKLGGSMYFLPKPFEVGAIATMAERITEQFMDDKATGKLFRDRMSDMFMQTFAFNPVPQLFQPMLDIYSNKDAFTKRDIESMSMERLSKGLRARDTTTAAAHAVSSATRALGDDSPVALSPIQADHLIRGYFGAVGANVAALIDTAWRAANGETEPDKRWSEYQPIRRFYKDLGAPEPYTRYSTLFYEGLREAARVHADVRELRSLGRMDEASALMADKRNVLAMRLTLERQQRRISEINKQLVSVRRSDRDGAWKRREIDRLNTIKGAITEQWGRRIEEARAAG